MNTPAAFPSHSSSLLDGPSRADGVRVRLVGDAASWFSLRCEGETVIVSSKRPLSRRCTLRPAALFNQSRRFPDVNTVMGRLVFANGAAGPQTYTPFTRDPHRCLREVFFPVETMPDDDWPTSKARWWNYQEIAMRLLEAAEVPWKGLSTKDVEDLVGFVPWPEPLEGCVLHALAEWTHACGECVIEIGSFRGRSLSMLALALRGAGSDSFLISIDPHREQPFNQTHARLALAQIGEESRLVQLVCSSDRAWPVLRPEAASLIFVDGDHTSEQVAADFEHYRDLLAPGGCLAFHDYGYGNHNGRPEADPEVRASIDRHVFGAQGFRPLLLAHTLMVFVKEPARRSCVGR